MDDVLFVMGLMFLILCVIGGKFLNGLTGSKNLADLVRLLTKK